MPAAVHWFRVGYMANALRRCAAEADADLASLDVRGAVALMERFVHDYRAQHVHDGHDVVTLHWGPAGNAFAVTIGRSVHRDDQDRSDAVRIRVLLRATPARRALDSGLVTTTDAASLRRSEAVRRTAAAVPVAPTAVLDARDDDV